MSQRNVTVVSGVSGMGKGLFDRRLLLNHDYALRFIFDSENSERDPAKLDFADWLGLRSARTPYDLCAAACSGWIAFDPHEKFAGRLEEALDVFLQWALDLSLEVPGEKIIVVPEIWRYCKPQWIPKPLAEIVQSGRRRRLHLLVDTQEPNRLNSSILNGVSEWVTFKLTGELALDQVKHYGFDPAVVSQLKSFEFISRDQDTGGELRGTVAV